MDRVGDLVLGGAVVVFVFDAVASLITVGTGIPYPWFTVGSITIYMVVGYLAGARAGLGAAIGAATAVAAVEGTFGMAVSVLIGPGRLDPSLGLSPAATLLMSLLVTLPVGAFFGWVGGRVGRRAISAG